MDRGNKYFDKRMNGRLGRLFYSTWLPPREIIPAKFFPNYIKEDDFVLDIGCSVGINKTFKTKLSKNYFTLDIDPSRNPDYIADAHEFAEKCNLKKKFNVIISLGLLEHIKEPQKVIDQCYIALMGGGRTIHWVPFIYRVHATYGDYWRFTEDGLKHLFRKYKNVKIIPAGGFFSILVKMFNESTAPLKDIGFIIRVLFYPLAYLLVKLDRFTPQEIYCRGYYVIADK